MKSSISEQRVQEFRDRIPLRYIQKVYCAAWTNGEYCTCMACAYEDKQYSHYQKINRESYFGREDNSFRGII